MASGRGTGHGLHEKRCNYHSVPYVSDRAGISLIGAASPKCRI
jgi:hypothetical protein